MALGTQVVGGLGNATDANVDEGVTYTSDNGIKRQGTRKPVPIDETLTEYGQAADAGVTGTKFGELEESTLKKAGHTPNKNVSTDGDGNITLIDLPDKLPNPSKLKFSGAVTGEYDGSTEQTINIPTIAGPTGPQGEKGEPGVSGIDGQDGVSVTHSWTGTTLNITSASGTSSVDLKGEKGDTGQQGNVGADGPKGDKGEPFIYSDFTQEQLNSLKGPKGDIGITGERGPKGDPFVYSDFTTEQLESLRGPQGNIGPKGDKGDKGEPFIYSDFTQEQLNSLKGPKGDTGPQGEIGATGERGPQGEVGATGQQGPKGDTGLTGPKGDTGSSGKSAYQYAVDGGFTGTEQAFINKLAKEEWISGIQINGKDFPPDSDGKVNIQIASYYVDTAVPTSDVGKDDDLYLKV